MLEVKNVGKYNSNYIDIESAICVDLIPAKKYFCTITNSLIMCYNNKR